MSIFFSDNIFDLDYSACLAVDELLKKTFTQVLLESPGLQGIEVFVNKEAIAVLIENADLVEKEMGFEGNYPIEYSIYLGGYKFFLWGEDAAAEMIKNLTKNKKKCLTPICRCVTIKA